MDLFGDKAGIDIGMRRFARLIGSGFLVCLAGLTIWLTADFVVDGWFDDKPFFDLEGEHTFNCVHDPDLPADAFWVVFSIDPTQASIRFRDREAVLTFQRGGFVRDVYEGEGITLIIDPEVYVTGYRTGDIGPCDGYKW